MSKVYTDPENYENIAEAIRDQIGTSDTYKPSEMADAIRSIAGGGGSSTAFCYAEAIRLQSGSTYEFTAPIPKGLCVVEAIHRDTITVPSDWTRLYTTEGSSIPEESYHQMVSVFYKHFEDPHISFTETIAGTTGSWPVNIHIFKSAGDPKVYKKEQLTTGQHISLVKGTSTAVLWSRHEIYWWSDAGNGWRTTEGWQPIYVEAGSGRLCTVVDYTYGHELDIYPSGALGKWAGEVFAISIPGEGETVPVIEPITITENGVYPAPSGTDGYSPVRVNVSGGGGSGNADIHWYAQKICTGDVEVTIHSDCELKSPLDPTDFLFSENIKSLRLIDSLNIRATLDTEDLSAGDTVSFSGMPWCYRFSNGSAELEKTVTALGVNDLYESLPGVEFPRDMLVRMRVIRNNVRLDEGNDTLNFTISYPGIGVHPAPIKTFYANGNSIITATGLTLNVNQRDAATWYLWQEEGQADGVGFLKIRWKGASAYSGAIDHEFETVFLTNGDFILRLIQKGTNVGNYSFNGTTYQVTTEQPLCFYRADYYGGKWDILPGEYDFSKHHPEATEQYKDGTLAEYAKTTQDDYALVYNIGYDDNAYSYTFDDFTWHGLGSVTVSGNSWIGVGGGSENIRMHRRDSKMLYLYLSYWHLTDLGNMRAIKFTWGGASQYNGSIDRWWILWLFENGDAMIYVKTRGNNTGTSDFYGQSYTANNDSFISFYYDPSAGNYSIQYELYDIEHHIDAE